ncbi:MAG TPA: HAMP domain-containing sensor histidine kinase [Janthinobacterium sp.]|jgi:signal transduction histidine kinase|nr:HAMP domain-containing sensor histidine kinase [Janthinobacterium sp.]
MRTTTAAAMAELAIFRLPASIAAKLVLGYGVLGMASVFVVSAVFYFGTIGVLDHNLDGRISVLSDRLVEQYRGRPQAELAGEVAHQLSDGIDSDSEIFLLLDESGARLAGNLSVWPQSAAAEGLTSRDVVRDGRRTPARLLIRRLDGGTLVVGRDLSEQESVRTLVLRSLVTGAALSLLLTVFGALLFRRQIERRIGEIRHTAKDIEEGDLSRRIPVSGDDEFSLLNRDINRMLDRIEHLMDGIRHVSNAIAHDLRTPLSRIRSKLDDALRHEMTVDALAGAAHGAIEDIDDLIRLFERLLQIAEAESGMRAQLFVCMDLNRIALDMADMYDASAEDRQVTLATDLQPGVQVLGDRNLLASAVASLIDNAIKYAGPGAAVVVRTQLRGGEASIAVCDNGPGIPAAEFGKVTQRFYRLDKSRSLPGNGLGLSIVGATASMHGGRLSLEDGQPGLIARIILPQMPAALAPAAARA